MRVEKSVFICYRRANYHTALAVFQHLEAHGYDVFLDYKSIPSGDWRQLILNEISARPLSDHPDAQYARTLRQPGRRDAHGD